MYKLYFNNKFNTDLGVSIVQRPIIPVPEPKVEVTAVSGRDGDLYNFTKGYSDIVLNIDFYLNDRENLKQKYRNIKSWLLNVTERKLIFTDDPEYFYKVELVKIPSGFETELWEHGMFTAEFTVHPYMFKVSGQDFVTMPSKVFNDLDYICKPTYLIKGEGLITLNVNGNEVIVNVGQYINIDTDTGLCYRAVNDPMNSRVTGNIRTLYINPGANTFSTKLGTGARLDSIQIKYNWRCL